MDRNTLDEILWKHQLWLNGEPGGEYANLYKADLRGEKLSNANLCLAYLEGINLIMADISNANLSHANLIKADLRKADLRGANLYGALLYEADITDVKVDNTTKWFALRCPERGHYIGYKLCMNNLIVRLGIPADAKRSSATTKVCRASKAEVLSITNIEGDLVDIDEAVSMYNYSFIYRVGETVEVLDFDENRWNECSTGIHHFMTRQEAVDYSNILDYLLDDLQN